MNSFSFRCVIALIVSLVSPVTCRIAAQDIISLTYSDDSGQNLMSSLIEQNGNYYGFDHVFTEPSPLKISLSDDAKEGEWIISKLVDTEAHENVVFSIGEHGECVIDPSNITWGNAFRIFDPSLSRDLFELQVRFISNEGLEEINYIRLALLPARPIISDVTFSYIYNWENDCIYPNGDFSFIVHSNSATQFYFYYSDSFLFDFNEHVIFRFSERLDTSDMAEIRYPADWGEYINVTAGNKFGYVKSDVICTTSYITDEDVLNRIAELKEQADVVLPIEDNSDLSVGWDNTLLTFDREMTKVLVYNICGSLAAQERHATELDLSHLSNGVYIVSCEHDNKLKTFKIVKR